jgi:TolA-binding protein
VDGSLRGWERREVRSGALTVLKIRIRTISGILASLLLCAVVFSCAYFNTLYNARRLYAEAEERRENEGSERELRDRYGQVVEKCAKVVRDYPDSKWVDDALFLMGKALVRQGEADKGIRKFIEITTNFPESDYVPPSLYWLGLAHWEKGDDNQALAYTERFLAAFPDHDLKYDVMFLAGDIKREMGLDEEALSLYALVADEAPDRDVIDAATLRTAELYFAQGEYTEAAAAYEALLRKGISWKVRYEISRSLGDCYTRIGKCREALELFDRLSEESTTTKEKPPLELGRAASHVCMDSLETSLGIYEDITKEFPKSKFSAEAFYRMGVIYHERLDSLSNAQVAFSKVASEYANSEFASEAIQKSSSLKRLLELSDTQSGAGSSEQLAEKRFLAAEIQLTRLGEIDIALANYEAIVDSFPESSYAPRAAFAVAWINEREKLDREQAIEMYRRVVSLYPRSMQAVGAVDRIGSLGAQELKEQLQALVDSAAAEAALSAAADSALADTTFSVPPADTAGVERPRRAKPARLTGDGAAAPADSVLVPRVPAVSDSTAVPPDTVGVRADSTAVGGIRPADGGKEGTD